MPKQLMPVIFGIVYVTVGTSLIWGIITFLAEHAKLQVVATALVLAVLYYFIWRNNRGSQFVGGGS